MALFTSSKIQTVSPAKRVQGEIQLPGDKSISHRLAVLGAIAEGPTEIHFFSPSADCASTLECLKALGVRVERHSDVVTLQVLSRTGDSSDGWLGQVVRIRAR